MNACPTRRTPATSVVESVHDEGVVLFNTATGSVYSVNTCGGQIWRWLREGAPVDRLADRLAGEYGIERGQAEPHVERFVDELTQLGLLEARR
jgi:PqqD family protein of HPr-rel-A system